MQFIKNLFGKTEKRATGVSNPSIARVLGISSPVEAASKLSTASNCISLISSTYASYDAVLYKLNKDGSPSPAAGHALYEILMNGTAGMSSFEIRLRLMRDLVTHGNCYAHVEFDADGKIKNLTPLACRNTVVEALGNGRLIYRHSDPLRNYNQTVYRQDDIFHGKWMPVEYMGRSPIELAALSMGIAVGVEEATKADAERGFRAGGILSAPGAIGPETASRLKAHLETDYMGADGAGKIVVAGDGLTLTRFSLSNKDAELVENRKFNSFMVAQAYGVPGQICGLPFESSWNSASEANRQFVSLCMEPWSKTLNDQLAAFALSSRERKAMYISNNWQSLISGSLTDRASAYSSMLTSGLITANEARAVFDLPRVDGGDELRVPLNAATVSGAVNGKPAAGAVA